MIQLLLAADDAEHAAAKHAEVLDIANILPGITALVVFGIAFFYLYLKVWPQITKGLDDRQNKIREEIASAEASREKANAALAEYEASLATARKDAADMIANARTDAKAAAEELRVRNEADLSEMKDRASRDIDAAKRAAISELHAEAANLATSIATKILQREISSDDQQRLVDESLREMAGAAPEN